MSGDPYIYLCDPEKNKECKKTCCQKECKLTIKREYSKDGKRYRLVDDVLKEVK